MRVLTHCTEDVLAAIPGMEPLRLHAMSAYLPDGPADERHGAQQASSRALAKGLAGSLFFHLAVLAVLLAFRFTGGEAEIPGQEGGRYLEVVLSSLPSRLRPPSEDIPASAEAAVPAGNIPDDSSPATVSTGPVEVPASVREEPVQRSGPRVKTQTEGGTSGNAVLSPAALKDSIAAAVQGYRSEFNTEWLEACREYRNRHGTRDCPEDMEAGRVHHDDERALVRSLFADLTRPTDNARRANSLLKEMAFLRTLEKANPLMQELAAERYFLQLEKFDYLAGAENSAYSQFRNAVQGGAGNAISDTSVNLLGTGSSLVGGILSTLDGRGSLNQYGTGSGARYTEYRLARPEKRDE